MDAKIPSEYQFGIKIQNILKVNVKAPFEVIEKPSYKCFSAYYVSENEDPTAAMNRLRKTAKDAGLTLTGEDRIVYMQMLFADRNIYELQIGVR